MNRFSAPTTSRIVSNAVENGVVLEGVSTVVQYVNEGNEDQLNFHFLETTQDGYRKSLECTAYLNGKQIAVSTAYGILASQFTYARA